jgi:hypothetical protein
MNDFCYLLFGFCFQAVVQIVILPAAFNWVLTK